jgi:hypothetical protein
MNKNISILRKRRTSFSLFSFGHTDSVITRLFHQNFCFPPIFFFSQVFRFFVFLAGRFLSRNITRSHRARTTWMLLSNRLVGGQ